MIRDTFDMFQQPDRGRFGDNESIRGNDSVRSDLIDLSLALHHETERAVLVSVNGEEARALWLPKSLIEIERKNSFIAGHRKSGQVARFPCVVITLPLRLAEQKGLV